MVSSTFPGDLVCSPISRSLWTEPTYPPASIIGRIAANELMLVLVGANVTERSMVVTRCGRVGWVKVPVTAVVVGNGRNV